MTADQQAAEALGREWTHALFGLPPRPCLSDHATVLKHRRCQLSLGELLTYYSKKLPPHLFGPALFAAGRQLVDRGEHRLAAALCFKRLADLNLPSTPADSKLDAAGRLGLHVQALYGLHASNAAEAMLQDSQLQHQHTITAALAALAGLQAACELVVCSQPLLVHAGTLHMHEVASKLAARGRLHAQVLPHLLFAAHAMECHISLCSPQYLPWRVQLYAAAAECYHVMLLTSSGNAATLTPDQQQQPPPETGTTTVAEGGGGPAVTSPGTSSDPAATAAAAQEALAGGLSQLASIARAQALDAVPAPEVSAAVQAAQAQLVLLQSLVELQPPSPAAAAAAATPPGSDQPPAAAAVLLSSIKPIGSAREQLAALLRLLQAGLAAYQCPLSQVQLPASLQTVMAAAWELAGSVLGLGTGAQAAAAAGDAGAPAAPTVLAAATLKLHMDLLLAAYRYQQQDMLQALLTAALNTDDAGPAACSSRGGLVAAAAVLDAAIKLQASSGETTAVQHLAAVLVHHSYALGTCMPQLLAAAALELHAAAGSMLQGCFGIADGNAAAAQAVLEALHAALQQSDHSDGVLRGGVALRLAAMLEEQQQMDRALTVVQEGMRAIVAARTAALTHLQDQPDEHLRWISGCRTQPDDATAALLQGMSDNEQELACLHADALMLSSRLQLKLGLCEAATKASTRQQRMQATLQKRDQQADIFGARTRKERRMDAVAVESAGQVPSSAPGVEQKLLLECGRCPYQRALVLTSVALMQPDCDRQAALLEEACDALHSAHAVEAELFASQQPSKDALRPLSAHHLRPINPNILRRTPNCVTLALFPIRVPRDARQPAAFAAFCKPASGVSLTINKTAAEYPGSGVQVPLGSRVTIDGLESNAAYNFAIAVYDDQGLLMGELGASSPSVILSLPLPIYYLVAQVLLAAAHLQLWGVAKRAAAALFPRFFTTTAARPLWQAHPADRFSTQPHQVAAQVPAFLRLLVQSVYAYAGHQVTKQLTVLATGSSDSHGGDSSSSSGGGSALAGTAASRELLLSLSQSHVEQQRALLEGAKRHLLAMQVAAQAGDELLVEEGALRVFNLLRPLLQRHDVSPALFLPLSELHTLLAAVRDTGADTIAGHKQQRQSAAQALAAAAFWKLRLLEPVFSDLAAGAASIAAHGVLGLQLQPSQALTALDGALLRALAGSSTGLGSSAAPTMDATSLSSTAKHGKGKKQPTKPAHKAVAADASAAAAAPVQGSGRAAEQAQELVALQELLLWHPSGLLWAADLHARRCGDPLDLAAQVLPKLHQPHALTTCWPLLSAPEVQQHPKWLPLCVLLMQAVARQHGAALWLSLPPADKAAAPAAVVGVSAADLPPAARLPACAQLAAAAAAASELLQAIQQHVRMMARRPQFLTWPSHPKWSVDAAAAALEAQGFQLGDQGTAAALPQPEVRAGMTADAKAATLAAWQQQNADLLATERRRLAAAQLLQQRLPVMLGRRRAILAARQQLAALAPWLSQLHSITGGLAAEAAAQLLAANVPSAASLSSTHIQGEQAAALQPIHQPTDGQGPTAAVADSGPAAPSTEPPGGSGAAAVGTTAAAALSATGSRPVSPRKLDSAEGLQTAQAAAASTSATPKANAVEVAAQQLTLQAHQQFAQAATLAARHLNHQQLRNISRQLKGISTYLLNKLPALLTPVPAVKWTIAPLPEPLVPPLLATAPEHPPADASAGTAGKATGGDKKGAAAASGGGKAAASAGDKKPVGGVSRAGKQAVGTPRADAKRTLLPEPCSVHVGQALTSIASALLAVLQHLRAQTTSNTRMLAASGMPSGGSSASGGPLLTSRSNASAATSAITSVFSFGSDAVAECWHTGSGVDVPGLTQVVVVVLKVLHNMERWSCMLRLGSAWLDVCQGSADAALVPLLLSAATQSGAAVDVAALTEAQRGIKGDLNQALVDLDKVRLLVVERIGGLQFLGARSLNTGDSSSLTSAASVVWRSASAASDDQLLPAEYERVIANLTKRGEKGHMILALSELGDLHAHFGHWSKATDAWSASIDALLGPYHAVHTWQHKLQLGSHQQLLRRYGVHGLLLAATLLGKLARFSYQGQLGTRLSCALLAAELLLAVFGGDIVHPQRRVDFAAYVPVELWPGANVFGDTHRCNAAALTSSLECLSGILQEQQLHLLTLPLLALWEHTSLYVTHDRASTVLARITRVKALAALGLMSQAAAVLKGLMQGAHLPGLVLGPSQPVLGGDGVAAGLAKPASSGKDATAESAAATAADGDGADSAGRQHLYRADKPPSHPSNAAFLQFVAEAVVQPAVVGALGPWLCGHLNMARAAFLAAAGGVVDCWLHSKPSAVAAAVKAGPPAMPVAATGAAAGSVETAAPAVPSPPAKGGKQAAAVAGAQAATSASTAAGGKATAGIAAAAATGSAGGSAASMPQVGAGKLKLLAAAASLLQGVVTVSCSAAGMSAHDLGIPWAASGNNSSQGASDVHSKAPAAKGAHHGTAGKDKSSTAKSSSHSPGKGGKAGGAQKHSNKAGGSKTSTGAQQPQQQQNEHDADAAAAERRAAAAAELLVAQHQQLLIQALLQLAAVQAARWLPLQALPLCLAASDAVKHVMGSSSSSSSGGACSGLSSWAQTDSTCLDSRQAESKAALQPSSSTWLASRWQLAQVLLQLQHTGPCVGVCLKALTDAARAGDVAWSARLLELQSAALAARQDFVGALNCCRTTLSRLEEHKLPGCCLLPLQQAYAALCDEVGARGDFDRLSCTSLSVSAAEVEELGLTEMREHPQLTNIYLPATSTHLTALLQAAAAATRRRQLVSAERHLRTAAELLGCCRCLPVHAAAVLAGLARVLRLQAALKLPDANLIGCGALAAATSQLTAQMPGATGGFSSSTSGVIGLQQQRLREAVYLLSISLQLLILDSGSNPVLVRSALLELAAVLVQQHQTCDEGVAASSQPSASASAAAGVAAVLRAAHVTASHVCKLYLESHSLQPVRDPSTCLPEWLLELLTGHEQLQTGLQQEAAAAAAAIAAGGKHPSAGVSSSSNTTSSSTGSAAASKAQPQQPGAGGTPTAAEASGLLLAVPDALGRLAVCFYIQQLTAMATGVSGLQQQRRAAEQALVVQPVLRAACARFAADCCWQDVPQEVVTALQLQGVGAAAAGPAVIQPQLTQLPSGTVVLQWYRQDGCWQVPSSWSCHGALPPSGQISSDALASLPKQQPCVSCLYVLVVPAVAVPASAADPTAAAASSAAAGGGGGPPVVLQGELVLSLERAKRVQLQVKAMRSRLECPGKPTDLFAQPAPTSCELAGAKHSVECLLAGVAEDNMQPAPADLPPPPAAAAAPSQPAARSSSGAGAAASPAGGKAGGDATSTPGTPAKPPANKGATAAVAPAAGKGAAAGALGAASGSAGSSGVAASDPASLELDWRQLQTWANIDMLLDLEAGLSTTDAAVAAWLGGLLQQTGV